MKERITKVEKKILTTWRRKIHLRKGKPGYITRKDYKTFSYFGDEPYFERPTLSIDSGFGNTIFLDDGREVPKSNIAYAEEIKPAKTELVVVIHKETGRFWVEKDFEIMHLGVEYGAKK